MNLKLYLSGPQTCSYLPEQESQSIFIDPAIEINDLLVSQLSKAGFRRSGSLLYRPHCEHCQQCMSCRVTCDKFKPSNSQKRILRKAKSLNSQMVPMAFSMEHYSLYERYIEQRHADGDMYPANIQQYRSFLINSNIQQQLLEIRDQQNNLICGAVVDCLEDGISAVYSYFEPELAELSLGQLAILEMINFCKNHNLPYLYLGYWIKDSQKMRYKQKYQPIAFFDGKSWLEAEELNMQARDL